MGLLIQSSDSTITWPSAENSGSERVFSFCFRTRCAQLIKIWRWPMTNNLRQSARELWVCVDVQLTHLGGWLCDLCDRRTFMLCWTDKWFHFIATWVLFLWILEIWAGNSVAKKQLFRFVTHQQYHQERTWGWTAGLKLKLNPSGSKDVRVLW